MNAGTLEAPTEKKEINPRKMRAELADHVMKNSVSALDIEHKLDDDETASLMDLLYKVAV